MAYIGLKCHEAAKNGLKRPIMAQKWLEINSNGYNSLDGLRKALKKKA